MLLFFKETLNKGIKTPDDIMNEWFNSEDFQKWQQFFSTDQVYKQK